MQQNVSIPVMIDYLGDIQQLRGQDEGGRGSKISVFVHAQGIKTVHVRDEGFKTWQNSVHVVVECPLSACYAI